MISMTIPTSPGPSNKKRKLLDMDKVSSITSSQGSKSSSSYSFLLYCFSIFDEKGIGIISPLSWQNQICQYFLEQSDIPLVSSLLKNWFLKYEPNVATLVQKICQHIFPWNIHFPGESLISLLFEFLGPFKGHNIRELQGDKVIRYPFIKWDLSQG